MYKKAAQLKLRFTTVHGTLSVEQLFGLSLHELDKLAVSLEKQYKASKGKSFLAVKAEKDKTTKLRFDIVLDILQTKVEERDTRLEEAEVREHNQEIMRLIKEKEKSELSEKSIKELKAMIK